MDKPPTASSLYLAVWFLFPVLVPFYLMGTSRVSPQLAGSADLAKLPMKVESGVPQLADFLVACLIGLVAVGIGLCLQARVAPAALDLLWFVLYATAVNALWAFLLRDIAPMESSLFYVYDFLLFLTFLVLYSQFQDRLVLVTVYAVAASVFLQAALSPLKRAGASARQTLFFNNPNQLGYYAVLSATLFFLGTKRVRIPTWLQAGFYLTAGYLAALSLSKAALAGLAVLAILIVWDRPGFLLLGAPVLAAALISGAASGLFDKLEHRLATADADETLGQRGYDRIGNHPGYLAFGAGEGAYLRFISEHPGEMHSSFGTLFFSYGVIGSLLFARALLAIVRLAGLRASLALVPVFLYGLTHHGLRATLFWVVLALLACLRGGAGRAPPDDGLMRATATA